MIDPYCLNIEFPEVDLSPYNDDNLQMSRFYHAHLYLRKDEIELRIFYEYKSSFGEKLEAWISQHDFTKFGKFIKVNVDNHIFKHLNNIDFSDSKLISISNGTNYYEDNQKYVTLYFDTVKLYWSTKQAKKNTADFYLDDKGFRIVEPFYGLFAPQSPILNNGKFEMKRMKDSDQFFEFQKCSFRPEFSFYWKDSRKDRTPTIVKEPKIRFKYNNPVTEEEALYYGEVVLLLASFYYHINIEYTSLQIHVAEHSIIIKRIEEKNFLDKRGGLNGFGIVGSFQDFLHLNWKAGVHDNYSVLLKAIKLFNQSLIVDDSSAFIIRYNIIEICGKKTPEDSKWKFNLEKSDIQSFFVDIKERIKNVIDDSDRAAFESKWPSVEKTIQSKSLRKQLEDTFQKNNIDSTALPIRTNKIVELRNYITHGSLESVNSEELRKANILLYRISGILILNLMGVREWSLNSEIK